MRLFSCWCQVYYLDGKRYPFCNQVLLKLECFNTISPFPFFNGATHILRAGLVFGDWASGRNKFDDMWRFEMMVYVR